MKKYAVRSALPQESREPLAEYPELLQKLLFYRGIDTKEKAQEFLNPNYETGVHDPYLMKDMDKAVARILQAIENNENILIYSDYDADGIPAAVVIHDFFALIGYKNFEVYIPHRHNEGYGLHLEAIETFVEKNIKLMITLDCGIVDCAEVDRANALGIDVIVTDHHLPGEKLPHAVAILNAKQTDCTYPYDMLCGSGVAFKLVQALIKELNTPRPSATPLKGEIKPGAEKWLLDMVGLATLSDMVPLKGENRVLAHYGLKVLRKTRRPGLLKLLSIMNIRPMNLTEDDIGFMITPRINAASRMGVPHDAYHMLRTTDEAEAHLYAKHLDSINNERKGLVAATVKEIKKILHEREDHYKEKKVIVLGNPDWRPAILGLAANSLVEEHGKPVFLWGREGGKDIKGSCRSDGVVSVVEIMAKARPTFIDFGGHKMSGGFSVDHEHIHTLEDALNTAYESLNMAQAPEEEYFIDAELSLDDITPKTFSLIDMLAPFGIDNPKPVFLFNNVHVAETKQFGKAQDHIELCFKNSQNKIIKAIGFFTKPEDFVTIPKKGLAINLVATLEKSYFKSYPELRLRIVDIL